MKFQEKPEIQKAENLTAKSKPQEKEDRTKVIGKKGYVNHMVGQLEGGTMTDGFASDGTSMESGIPAPPDCVITSSENDFTDSDDE